MHTVKCATRFPHSMHDADCKRLRSGQILPTKGPVSPLCSGLDYISTAWRTGTTSLNVTCTGSNWIYMHVPACLKRSEEAPIRGRSDRT